MVGSATGVADIVKNMKAAGIDMGTINSALKSMGIDLSKFKINPATGESLPPDMGTGNTNDSAGSFNPPDYFPPSSGGGGASLPPDLEPGGIPSLPPDLDTGYVDYGGGASLPPDLE